LAPARASRRVAQPRLVRGGVALAGTAGRSGRGPARPLAGTVTPLRRRSRSSAAGHRHQPARPRPRRSGRRAGRAGRFLHARVIPDGASGRALVRDSGCGGRHRLCRRERMEARCASRWRRQVQTTTPPLGDVTLGLVSCSTTSETEQDGFVTSVPSDGENVFAAIVPAGATVSLTDDGTTTPVSVDDGIATGVVPDTATLTIDVAGTSTSYSIPTAPSTEVWAWAQRSNAGSTAPAGTSARSPQVARRGLAVQLTDAVGAGRLTCGFPPAGARLPPRSACSTGRKRDGPSWHRSRVAAGSIANARQRCCICSWRS